MLVAKARERGVHRADLKLETELFQRQHLRVAKRLRRHWIPGVNIAATHRIGRLPAPRKNTTARACSPSAPPVAAHPYEKRTSLPGSISNSRSRESSMLGLITCS